MWAYVAITALIALGAYAVGVSEGYDRCFYVMQELLSKVGIQIESLTKGDDEED